MNIQQLRVFVQAVRCSTLTEVAAQLQLKQPTVSFHLKKLEEELGVELFRKQLRYLQLTEAGKELLPYARRIYALMDEAERLMKEHREQGRGLLKIGASYTPATYFMPPYLSDFQVQFPLVTPTLTVKQAGSILTLLTEYEVDVAVVSLPDTVKDGLRLVPLVQDELKLLLPPGHPLSEKESLTIADLSKEPFLVHEHGSTSRELSEDWARENGLAWNIRMELGAIETIKESVKHGIGIGILPLRSVMKEIERGELIMRDLPGRVNRRYICLAYRNEDVMPNQVQNFIRFMKSRCSGGIEAHPS
ncbi:LysR family transcriptional regulator [Paenibacillus beijingensis]|uniref:LysR family transcriptional regulator n=1 Tax=Paenibacillus beijingensis TaxID=1126833 RepID=A0A0D5NJ00_9BACL|nr:LysR family transcriptional regulator [Paenibacillus beijingensis]AJY75090.1 LysR family transcriptional regulator [Paenibacillus beijingensis]